MPKVKVSAFVRDTRALAKDSLEFWPKKQKVERKALPRELRDNFDALARRSPDGSVAPQELLKSLGAYAALHGKRADKNKDGYLTPAEARRLPKDLQDNYWDYVRVLKGKDWKKASNRDLAVAGRAALAEHLVKIMFNPRTREGKNFKRQILDGRTREDIAQLKAEMLDEAAKWSPTAAGWSRNNTNTRTLGFDGEFSELYTNIFFERGKKVSVSIEID